MSPSDVAALAERTPFSQQDVARAAEWADARGVSPDTVVDAALRLGVGLRAWLGAAGAVCDVPSGA